MIRLLLTILLLAVAGAAEAQGAAGPVAVTKQASVELQQARSALGQGQVGHGGRDVRTEHLPGRLWRPGIFVCSPLGDLGSNPD